MKIFFQEFFVFSIQELLSDNEDYEPIGKVETNIDDSSDEEDTHVTSNRNARSTAPTPSNAILEQQRWLQQQKEKKERQKQEQQKLQQSYTSRFVNIYYAPVSCKSGSTRCHIHLL